VSALTDIFIKRPILAFSINLLLLIGGALALGLLNVRQYPRSDLAVIKVTTTYVGADSDLIRGFITTPLERVIASADGIDYLESSSAQNVSTITAHLKLNYDSFAALSQIQAKVAEVRNELPSESESPVITIETSDTRFASIYMSFYSKQLQQNQITDYLLRVVQPRLSSISGVQKAEILGARTYAMRVWLDPIKLASYKLTGADVRASLLRQNFLTAAGQTKGQLSVVNLSAATNMHSSEEFEQLVLTNYGDQIVRLRDVARVELGAENYDEEVRFDGLQATFMGVWVLPSANSLDVIKEVRGAIPDIRSALPEGLQVAVPYDATEYIQDALDEVVSTLVETITIVIVVIFLFIGSVRGALIPVLVIPLSLIGGGIIMYAAGFTINLLTLLAIVLSVGLVVDDAIVMLENIERHMKEGAPPLQAATQGARELLGPIVAMTITLATVYTPIGLQGGLTGTVFREFAFTLAGTVLISGFVALTLTPVMCALLLKQKHKVSRFSPGDFVVRAAKIYTKLLRVSLGYTPAIISGAFLFSLAAIPLYLFSMKELAPREDQGVVFGIVQASPNSSLELTSRYAQRVHDVFRQQPESDHIFQITGSSFGFSGAVTKPWSQRHFTTQQIEQRLWPLMGAVPGVRVIVATPPPLPGGSDFPVELVLKSVSEPLELLEVGQQLVGAAFGSGMFMFADLDLKVDMPQVVIEPDRQRLAGIGLSPQQVGNNISSLMSANYVNRFDITGRSYKVIAQVQRSDRLSPYQLLSFPVSAVSADPSESPSIPLGALAELKERVIPRQLNKFQQLNSIKIQGAQVPGVTIDQALSFLESRARDLMPTHFSLDYAGESRQLREEGSNLMSSLLIAFVLIFFVLAAQFESLTDPLIILMGSVPLALSGALLFSFLGFSTLNIYSQVGFITLIGLVAKNSILIVEFANEQLRTGVGKYEAILSACEVRFRPVLMTTLATVLGHFPLVLASGAGAAARNSIGITLVAGMIIGTLFTLLVVPSIYMLIGGRGRIHYDQ
jgi:multidrug efflux pump